jgi:hypothetical protein
VRRLLPVAVVVAALAPIASAGTTAAPRLERVEGTSLVLAGSGFRGGERVSVTVLTGYGARWARVVARRGRFRVAFRVPDSGCGAAWAARAVGSRGSRATLRLGAPTPCIPPPSR